MIPAEVRDLLNTLLTASEDERVNWVSSKRAGIPSSGSEDFVVTMPTYSLNVWRGEFGSNIYFSILDSAGDSILEYTLDPPDDDFELLEAMKRLKRC